MPTPSDLDASYPDHVAQLERRLDADAALRQAVGGEFVAIGRLEFHLLRSRGLRDDHLVVDVGCGSGRLACQLAPFPGIRYVGCDVVPRLLDYARGLCARPDWKFEATSGSVIPCADGVADFVCFFSVFTHLHQEEIYRYLREARRVLKPGGLVLFSFLEFRVPSHWAAFIASVDETRADRHLNQFIERDAIHAWAPAAGFDVRSIHGGDTNYIPLSEEVRYESGAIARGAASLGQSLAVLQKRGPETAASSSPAGPDPAAAPASVPGGAPASVTNASARTFVPAGGSATLGFMVQGSQPRSFLVRAIGPTLSMFGVAGPLRMPGLKLYAGDRILAQTGGPWRGDPVLSAAAQAAGAFPLAADSSDAALLVTLAPGNYTAVAGAASAADSGEVLLEVYLLPQGAHGVASRPT